MPRRLSFALAAAFATACVSFAGSRAEPTYLPAHGESAVMFAPGIVSTGDVFASTFTRDGRTVVFTKFSPPRPMMLMTSSFVDGRWTEPTVLPFSGTYRDLDPALSPDDRRLYYSSTHPVGESTDTTNVDTWYVEREGSGWSRPMHLASPINGDETDMYPSVTNRGVLYFDSYRSRPRRRFVYRAEPRADGTLGEPQRLDAAVNADSGASNLFVDPDERYVVFGAVRPGGAGGMDLHISWRTPTGWTTARNLGATVNTPAVEFCPFVSRDGKYLYFTRVVTIGARMERNVYVVRFDQLRERLR
jgi:Tol biopolymer transport system component